MAESRRELGRGVTGFPQCHADLFAARAGGELRASRDSQVFDANACAKEESQRVGRQHGIEPTTSALASTPLSILRLKCWQSTVKLVGRVRCMGRQGFQGIGGSDRETGSFIQARSKEFRYPFRVACRGRGFLGQDHRRALGLLDSAHHGFDVRLGLERVGREIGYGAHGGNSRLIENVSIERGTNDNGSVGVVELRRIACKALRSPSQLAACDTSQDQPAFEDTRQERLTGDSQADDAEGGYLDRVREPGAAILKSAGRLFI